LSEFLAMGGYGLYVWGSFGVCALVFMLEPLFLKQRQSRARRLIQREQSAARYQREHSSS